jgi:regulatory protein
VSPEITARVFDRLIEKKYVDDVKFAHFWVENRSVTKGTSLRKLTAELRSKGISGDIIDQEFDSSNRNDTDEMQKIIAKKQSHYPDDQKFTAYLVRLGFNYDDVKRALAKKND